MAFSSALIVDDSKLARITLRKKLESYGLEVVVAESAPEAYAAAESMYPDIIFMDHLMPDVDGFEATQYLRKQPATTMTPIIMCTGKEHDGYLDEALAIGASQILTKPPADEALEAILNTDFSDVAASDDMEVYHTLDESISDSDGLDDLQSNILDVRSDTSKTEALSTVALNELELESESGADEPVVSPVDVELVNELQQQVQQLKAEVEQQNKQLKSAIDELSASVGRQANNDSGELVQQLQNEFEQKCAQSIAPLQKQLAAFEKKLQAIASVVKASENKPTPVGISFDESKALIKRAFMQYKEKQPQYASAEDLADIKQAYDAKLEQHDQLIDSQIHTLSILTQAENEAEVEGENDTDVADKLEYLTRQQNDLGKLVHLPKNLSSIAIALGFCSLALSIYLFIR